MAKFVHLGYNEDHPSANMLRAKGWKASLNQLGTGPADTRRSYSHPQHGLIEHYSNGAWEHHNGGKLVREGTGHADLTKHLASLGSQHAEGGSLHEVLTKHGYEHQGRSTYKKGKFTVTAGENGKSWRHSHNPMGLDIGTNGWGHDTLDNHLGLLNRRFGSGASAAIRSQHAEFTDDPEQDPYQGVMMTGGGSNNQLQKHKEALKQHSIPHVEYGNVSIGSKRRHFRVAKAHVARAQEIGLTIAKRQPSQHAEEEQPTGHVTAELAEEILAERRTFNGNLV